VSPIFPSGGANEMSGKRINYNYHPIIDFFEKNRRAEAAATVNPPVAEESRIVEQRIYPQNNPKSQNGMGMGI